MFFTCSYGEISFFFGYFRLITPAGENENNELLSFSVFSLCHAMFIFQISVEFVDTNSFLYSKNKKMCEFWIRGTGHGELESPRHSLPPNTTCLYHLQVKSSNYAVFFFSFKLQLSHASMI